LGNLTLQGKCTFLLKSKTALGQDRTSYKQRSNGKAD
jgi:hypothetical protein